MEELVQFLILSIIAYLCAYALIILQELGESTLEHPIRATTDKILLLDMCKLQIGNWLSSNLYQFHN